MNHRYMLWTGHLFVLLLLGQGIEQLNPGHPLFAEIPDAAVEFYQQIHIAGGASFIAGNRPEQGKRLDAILLGQLSTALGQDTDHSLAVHHSILILDPET